MEGEVTGPELKLGTAAAIEIIGKARRRAWPFRALAWVGALLARWWRDHRSEASVMNARDDMLKDIGLSRAEIEHWISGRPYL